MPWKCGLIGGDLYLKGTYFAAGEKDLIVNDL